MKKVLVVLAFMVMFCFGQNAGQDIGQLEQACNDNNDARACYSLGRLYHYGKTVKQDTSQARGHYKKACDLGYDEYCSICSDQCSQQDIEQFEIECSDRSYEICFGLARLYHVGLEVNKDIKKAAEYYEKACDGDHINACYRLAIFYQYGHGVKKNSKKVVWYYEKSCNGGFVYACSGLASSYLAGDGVMINFRKAVEYFEKACDLGSESSCNTYYTMYNSLNNKK
ncbi:MAG: sel1 repeat family protein [Campylobacteraceae bacterium]|jgi:hypothetical protein|nr:sel1 repeat family protein [Campylobacteraceae bacterium]